MPATVGLRRPPRAVVVAGEPHHCGEERISPGGLGGGGYSILSILGLASFDYSNYCDLVRRLNLAR